MENQQLYNFTTITSWGNNRKTRYLRALVNNLLPELYPSSLVVEVGPGRGEFADIIVTKDYNYIGIEPSQSLREELQAREYKILEKTIPMIDLADESVDLIYSYDVLEHLESYSIILDFFREAKRALKPGGYIVSSAPNAAVLGNIFYL